MCSDFSLNTISLVENGVGNVAKSFLDHFRKMKHVQ